MPIKTDFARNRDIVRAYKSGLTLAEVGLKFGLTFGYVREVLDSMGVDRRPKGGPRPRKIVMSTKQVG